MLKIKIKHMLAAFAALATILGTGAALASFDFGGSDAWSGLASNGSESIHALAAQAVGSAYHGEKAVVRLMR